MKFQTLKKLLWILLLIILFILLTGSCTSTRNTINSNSTIVNALEVMLVTKDKVESINNSEAPADVNEILTWAESICAKSIRDTNSYDFDYLLKKVDEINSIDPYLLPPVAENKNLFFETVINELRFRGLVAIQHNMEINYQRLPASKKFASTIIFASANTSISEIKTNLINRQIGILESASDKKIMIRCWEAMQRMLDETDIPMSETGDRIVQRSPYGIMIEKGELIGKLEEIIAKEINRQVKSFGQNVILKIRSSETKYKEFQSEIVIEDIADISSISKIKDDALAYFNEALTVQDNKMKIELYTKAVSIDTNFNAAYNNRGICYFDAKDFKKVLKLDPASVIVNSYLGNCYLSLENYETAIDYYSNVVLSGIADDYVLINRGLSYQKLNMFELAIKDYTEAIIRNPGSVSAYLNRAQCNTMLNEFEKAAGDYKQLIKINPGNSLF
ncbi:MAG: tetratricopeptide repeat protein [Bacteroidota bacterium]